MSFFWVLFWKLAKKEGLNGSSSGCSHREKIKVSERICFRVIYFSGTHKMQLYILMSFPILAYLATTAKA